MISLCIYSVNKNSVTSHIITRVVFATCKGMTVQAAMSEAEIQADKTDLCAETKQ